MDDRWRTPPGRLGIVVLMIAMIQPVATRSVVRGQEPAPLAPGASSDIRDKAGLFGADAIREARERLSAVERATGAATIIETIDTLRDEPADKVAIREAERSGIHGIFILIAKQQRKLEVLASRRYRTDLTAARRQAIREAFFQGFHRQDFNEGLKLGVAAIAKETATFRREEPGTTRLTAPEVMAWSGTQGDSPLVVRNHARLTLEGARAILAGAEAKARAMGLNVNIAVVDDGGHLLAFERMDQARPASVYTAITKAATAATMRQPSGPLPANAEHPDPLLNLALEHAAAAGGGKLTTLRGGVPILVDGQVIGGVGVGGGTGEQDSQVARAGIQAFSDRLAAHQQPAAAHAPDGASRPEEARAK
jgi:glc operon protein GlcG